MSKRRCEAMMSFRFHWVSTRNARALVLLFAILSPLVFPRRAGAQQASLALGAASGKAGQSVGLSVRFTAGSTPVSALQFDLGFPASLAYGATSTGPAAAAAGKSAQGTATSGGARILVFGANQTPLGSGAVAVVSVTIAGNAPPGTIQISIGGIIAADTNGSPVSVAGSDGSLIVTENVGDSTPPLISEVRTTSATASSARVAWKTDEPSDAQVEYGTSPAYGKSTPVDPDLETSHSLLLTGLTENTIYHYRVRSRDAAQNLAVSGDFTFSTTADSGDALITLSYPRFNTGDAPQPVVEDEHYTGVAIVNLDDKPARLKFTVFDASGSAVTGESVTNPTNRMLKPGEQLPIVDSELFGAGLPAKSSGGWVKLESPVSKIAGFFLMFDGSLSVLDGATVESLPLSSSILPEIEDQGFTRIHIANPNADAVTVDIDVVRADGTVRATVTRNIQAYGVLSGELFSGLFPGFTPAGSEYVRVSSSKGVLPFELLGKTAKYIEALNGQDMTQGSRTIYSPQFVLGGPWRSTLSIVNLEPVPGTVTLRFMRDDAVQMGESRVLPIAPRGKIYIDDPGFFLNGGGTLLQGYVEIRGSVRLAGSVVFGDQGRDAFASALPLVGNLARSVVYGHVASNETYFTGVSVLNPNDALATATIDVYGADGSLLFRTIEIIPAKQRRSRLLTEYFPSLVGQSRTSGYIRITTDRDMASFSLFGTNSLSVLSAIPAQVVQ